MTDQMSILDRIKKFSEDFADKKLKSYIQRISKSEYVGVYAKEINDSIWGTIKVSPLEIMIIDSPIIQRLRYIRQLGVVHWVYPGAGHSRFEHSLGVLHQAQQLINAINQSAMSTLNACPIDDSKSAIVRLCAILHDIGHGAFSHVSEHALMRNVELRVGVQKFAQDNGISKIQLSELVAYYIIGSPAFLEMLTAALEKLKSHSAQVRNITYSSDKISTLLQNAIIGKHIDEEIPLMHEIITGPFDADKLDYYARDARHAGIPSTLDISRLLQKITVRHILSDKMPPGLLKGLQSHIEKRYLFGLKWSGMAILDELHLSRVLLYSKIYRHKKVSAIESMVDSLFEYLNSVCDILNIMALTYDFSDDQILLSDSINIRAYLNIDMDAKSMGFIDNILCRIRDRNHHVVALSILPKYPKDCFEENKEQAQGLNNLVLDCKNEQLQNKLKNLIAEEFFKIIEIMPEITRDIDSSHINYIISISSKPTLGNGTEIDRALIMQGDSFVRGREIESLNRTAWADAHAVGKPQAILYAPRECAVATYIAAECVIRRQYNVVLPDSAMLISKQDKASVVCAKQKLDHLGWYTGKPFDIRPTPEYLRLPEIAPRVGQVAEKLKSIDEPIFDGASRRPERMEDRIVSWVAQFRDQNIMESALEALERIKVLGRDDSRLALTEFIKVYPNFKGATICPLGESKDSGAVQAYLARDLGDIFPNTTTIEDAADKGIAGPIVFIDDFIGSGSQAVDILGNWFDDDSIMQKQLNETRKPLNENQRNYIKDRPIAFVFVAGWQEGITKILTATRTLKLDATVFSYLGDDNIPFAFEDKSENSEKFKNKCQQIGESLLASEGKNIEKQKSRALGYGNRGMLLTSRLNVPSQTLTCLWMDGKYDGVDWHALIRRRKKN